MINPNDWQIVRLVREGASTGTYLAGGPAYGPFGAQPYVQFPNIWGMPVITTTAITAGTALVGCFRDGAQMFYRHGLLLEMSNSDQDDFIKNLVKIRAEIRAALAVTRPLCFCTVTAIA